MADGDSLPILKDGVVEEYLLPVIGFVSIEQERDGRYVGCIGNSGIFNPSKAPRDLAISREEIFEEAKRQAESLLTSKMGAFLIVDAAFGDLLATIANAQTPEERAIAMAKRYMI